jgi:hypothetical protein
MSNIEFQNKRRYRELCRLAETKLGVTILPPNPSGSKHRRIYMRTPDGIEIFTPYASSESPRANENWVAGVRKIIQQRRDALLQRSKNPATNARD